MAVQQCVYFCNNIRLVNGRVIRRITKYLNSTSTYVYLPDTNRQLTACGVFYRPGIEKVIKCYVYANFSGGYSQADADNA